MRLTESEMRYFHHIIYELLQHKKLQEMKKYIQHGTITTYEHCITVAYYSYLITTKLPFKLDNKSIIRGALLHDFYLYDWHIPDKSPKLHGFVHPMLALKNSKRYFKLNKIEEDIIKKHMWPLTLTHLPMYREAFLVSMVDKYCSLVETLRVPIFPKQVKSYIILNFMQD